MLATHITSQLRYRDQLKRSTAVTACLTPPEINYNHIMPLSQIWRSTLDEHEKIARARLAAIQVDIRDLQQIVQKVDVSR